MTSVLGVVNGIGCANRTARPWTGGPGWSFCCGPWQAALTVKVRINETINGLVVYEMLENSRCLE